MKKKILFVLIAFIFSVTTAQAAAVDTYGIGAKATAMGGAFSAYADDPFAVYYNPAGLSQIDGKVFSIGSNFVDPVLKLSDFKTGDTKQPSFSDKSDALIVPHIGYAMKVTDKISFGIAAYAPWGLELKWEQNPAKNTAAYDGYHSYYRRIGVTPAISYKISPKLSLGAGITIGRSEAGVDKKKNMLEDMGVMVDEVLAGAIVKNPNITTTNEAAAFYQYVIDNTADISPADVQKYTLYKGIMLGAESLRGNPSPDHGMNLETKLTDDANYSYNLGLMYNHSETLTFGLTYRSETKADFEGDVSKNGKKVTDAKMNYNHPQQIQAGVRYQPHSQFSIECDLVWTEWSINEEQIVDLDKGVEAKILPFYSHTVNRETFERRWEDTKQLRFGWEYKFNEMFALRGGYFYDPTPVPDDTLDVQWADADKKTYSIGTGFNFGKCTIDTTFQYTEIEKARVIGGESNNFNASYFDQAVTAKADGHLIGGGITLSYAF